MHITLLCVSSNAVWAFFTFVITRSCVFTAPCFPAAARVYFAPACGLSLALDTAPENCPGEPLVPAADLMDGG